jgi:hypothetical protein
VDPAERHHLHLQAPEGGPLASQAPRERARADRRRHQVHL